jgi:hypothetical protein
MITTFTCGCGRKLEIDADTWFMARKAVEKEGWTLNWQSIFKCPACTVEADKNTTGKP